MNPIREAIANLPGHWWHGGGFTDPDNSENHCALGHIREVTRNNENLLDGRIAFNKAWHLIDGVCYEQHKQKMAGFNDYIAQSEDEILAVLEKAAARWNEKA